MLLTRSGQHLFKEWRSTGRSDLALEESFEKVWELKADLRAIRRGLNIKSRPAAPAAFKHHPRKGKQ